MAQRPSYSVAPNGPGRSRVLSWGALIGIASLAMGALVLVFPRTDLLTILRNESTKGNRDLSIAYLRNLIRTEPTDLSLQLLLVEKLLDGNDFAATRLALTKALPLATASVAGLQAWNQWDLAFWKTRLAKAQTTGNLDESRMAASELIARIKRGNPALKSPEGLFVAFGAIAELQSALGVASSPLMGEAQAVQKQLLAQLLSVPSASAADLSRAAALSLANSRFDEASEFFLTARTKSTDLAQSDRLLRQAVQAQLAGGQPRAAWQIAVTALSNLALGDPGHWWLAELALGAAEPREAGIALRKFWPNQVSAATLSKTMSPAQVQTAWDIFAASGDLTSALHMADAALLQSPNNAVWLERKAQTSEWAGQAPQALASWLALLKRGGAGTSNNQALANVFRLGPMLYDDEAVLAAWLSLAGQRQLTFAEATKVVEVYERLGKVDVAIQFVRQQGQVTSRAPGSVSQGNTSRWLSVEASLLERANRATEAIEVLERLRPAGLTNPDGMLLASMYLRRGQPPLALRALESVNTTALAFDPEYWNLLADLAYLAGRRPLAIDALDQVIAKGKPQAFQAERAIRLRIDANRAKDAEQMASSLYGRFPQDSIVYAWIDAINAQNPPTGLAALLSQLGTTHRLQLEKSPNFLNRRAALFVRTNDFAAAKLDYQRSLTLRPEDRLTRTAYLWLLIDQRDTASLQAEIKSLSRAEQGNAAFAQVLTAAYQLVNEPLKALALMQLVARNHVNDFLWLMNYADTLELVGRQAQALRVRRHAWPLAQRAASRPRDAEQGRQALIAQLRLAADFAGGAQKSRLWQALGRLLQSVQTPAQKSQAQELVGAWLLSQGQFDAAQAWLWHLHLARIKAPLYQEFAVALAQNDTQRLVQLLDRVEGPREKDSKDSKGLGPFERLAILRQLGRTDAAVEVATTLASSRPEGPDDEGQAALQRDLLARASRISIQTSFIQLGALQRQATLVDASIRLSDQVKLTTSINSGPYSSRDTSAIAATPPRDLEVKAGIETRTSWGELKLHGLLRDALTTAVGFGVQANKKLGEHSNVVFEVALGERSELSSAMAVSGLQDRISSSFAVRNTDRLETQVSLAQSHFKTQTGAALGRSTDSTLAANLVVRRDYPDIRIKGQLRRSVIRADGQADAATSFLQPTGSQPPASFFLGTSSTAISASLGLGLSQSSPESYSRAWKPWGEIGFETSQTDSSTQTQGLLRLGVKGSVLGRDQLSLNLDLRPASGASPTSQGSNTLGLRYELFFDR